MASARTARTAKKREKFLAALATGLSVSNACSSAGLARRTAYDWRDADPDFAKAWDHAIEDGTDALEDEARRRAFEGAEEPVFYQGKQVGTVRKYSDTLLIFLLKGRRPDKFKDRVAHGGDTGVPPIKHDHKASALEYIEKQLAAIAARTRARSEGAEPNDGGTER